MTRIKNNKKYKYLTKSEKIRIVRDMGKYKYAVIRRISPDHYLMEYEE